MYARSARPFGDSSASYSTPSDGLDGPKNNLTIDNSHGMCYICPMKVRFLILDEHGKEVPLDYASPTLMALASKYHGREVTEDEYRKAVTLLAKGSRDG